MTNSEKIDILKSIQIVVYYIDDERVKSIQEQISNLNIIIDIHYFRGFTPDDCPLFITDKHQEVGYAETVGAMCCTKSFGAAVNWFVKNCPEKKYLITVEDDAMILKTKFQDKLLDIIDSYNKKSDEIDYVSLGYLPLDVNYFIEKNKERIGTIFYDFWKTKRIYKKNELCPNVWGTQSMLFRREITHILNDIFFQDTTKLIRDKVRQRINSGHLYAEKYDVLLIDHCISVIFKQSITYPPLIIEGDYKSHIDSHVDNQKLRPWSKFLDLKNYFD